MYPPAFIHYLIHFHVDRDYFECHEILEEHWKKEPTATFQAVWIGLIQVAVALYHQRRGNFVGALKLMEKAYVQLKKQSKQLDELGIHNKEFLALLEQRLQEIKKGCPYSSFNFPLKEELLHYCLEQQELDVSNWGVAADLQKSELLHKHTIRDRSEVISTRLFQKNLRERKRSQADKY